MGKVADFWVREFEAQHGVKPIFERRDGVILAKLHAHFEDDDGLAWAIRKYLKDADSFVANSGWSVPVFKLRAQKLLIDWKRNQRARLKPTAEMDNLIGRIGREP